MNVSDAVGAQLDWLVAKCEGYNCLFDDEVSGPWLVPQEGFLHDEKPLSEFSPSTDWSQGGPIIERKCIGIERHRLDGPREWAACDWHSVVVQGHTCLERSHYVYGPTPLIAAMRCVVAANLGDEVDVPDELI